MKISFLGAHTATRKDAGRNETHSEKSPPPPRGIELGSPRGKSISAILEDIAKLEVSELYSTISNVGAIRAGWMSDEIGTMKSGR